MKIRFRAREVVGRDRDGGLRRDEAALLDKGRSRDK